MTRQIFEESTNPLLDCRDERQTLQDERGNPKAERLNAQIIEIQRKHLIALDNASAEGCQAGQDDLMKLLTRVRKETWYKGRH